MELIKEVGATSIRLAHYQHDQYFYDLCDTEGKFVHITSKRYVDRADGAITVKVYSNCS